MSHRQTEPSVAAYPSVTLKSLLETPSVSSRHYRRLVTSGNAAFAMNNKKDLPGLSPPNALSLSPGSGPAAVAAWSVDQFESAAAQAFLGPSIWDKPNPYDSMAPVGGGPHDFKLEYMDLDEFLSENGLGGQSSSGGHGHGHHPSGVGSAGGVASPHESSCSSPPQTHLPGHGGSEENKVSSTTGSKERDESSNEDMSGVAHILTKDPMHMGVQDLTGGNAVNFDPRRRRFSEEELKPQPMVKKSKKQFVPDELKDEKYWARRRKNNLAAKRSRDARRVKENQIAIRAAYLEKENAKLREQLDKLTRENMMLRDKLTAVAKAEQKIVGQ